MSGIFQRISMIFRAKTDKALDKLEDPRQTLDYSYQRQLELLQKVRRGVADVATSRKRIELQANQLNTQADKLTNQAQKALEVGREDLAREALTRRSGLQQQLSDLQVQHAQLQGEEEMRDVGLAIQRAEDKTAQLQARAGAIDELLASGALDDPTGTAKDDITLELEQLASTSDVENELARMKASLGAGPAAAPQAIEGQPSPSGAQPPPSQVAQPPGLDAQTPQEYQAPPAQDQEAPPAQPQGDL